MRRTAIRLTAPLVAAAAVIVLSGCVDPLIRDPIALEDENPHVRRKTAAWLRGPEAEKFEDRVAALTKALEGDSDVIVRATAAASLGEIGEAASSAAPALIRALDSEYPLIATNSALSLGIIGSTEAAEKLMGLLIEHETASVRQSAARALGLVGGKAALPRLIGGLYDPDSRVRFAAADSLAAITGLDFGYDESAWKIWWRDRKKTAPSKSGDAE